MRKFQNCGLQVAYKDANVKRFCRRTAALAFVPVHFVCLASQAIKVSAPQLPHIRYHPVFWRHMLVGNFHVECLTEWLLQNQQPPLGEANRLKQLVGKAHPNVYEFVEVIQKEQTANEVSITQLEAGACPPRRTLKAITGDRKKQKLKVFRGCIGFLRLSVG